jgi:hypothetical protein
MIDDDAALLDLAASPSDDDARAVAKAAAAAARNAPLRATAPTAAHHLVPHIALPVSVGLYAYGERAVGLWIRLRRVLFSLPPVPVSVIGARPYQAGDVKSVRPPERHPRGPPAGDRGRVLVLDVVHRDRLLARARLRAVGRERGGGERAVRERGARRAALGLSARAAPPRR